MKKLILSFLITCSFFSVLFAQDLNKYEIKFIKGNVSDKISCIKDSDKNTSEELAKWGIDFVLKNMTLLKDDRDLAGLAIASVMAYSENEWTQKTSETSEKLDAIFYGFTDKNVRLSIIDKYNSLHSVFPSRLSFHFLIHYLTESCKDNVKPSEVERKAITVIGSIGNHECFSGLYEIYKSRKWQSVDKEIIDSLVSISEQSAINLIQIISTADYTELKSIYNLFVKNDKISTTLKAELSENLLNRSMLIVRDSSSVTKDISDFQFELCKILCESNWTRSSSLIISYFEVAKTETQAGFITEAQFAEIIKYIEKLSSKDSVNVFVKYLESLNAEMNDGKLPSITILSALISALGDLGDKAAFDCLLYTTYLNYPEDIISQARSALSSLKW